MPRHHDITYFARTTHRDAQVRFGIRKRDRRFHMYAIGKTGVGKTNLLKTLAVQDMHRGHGLAVIEPHGDLIGDLAALVPTARQGDLIHLDLAARDLAWHFNPLGGVPALRRPLAAAGLVEVFKRIWADDWGPRLEHVLRHVFLTLLDVPGSTLADVPLLLTNKDVRKSLVRHVTNPDVRDFWKGEFAGYSPGFRAVVTAPILNKISGFLTDPMLKRVLTGGHSSFRLRSVMDEGKILLVNLAKGQVGDGPSTLLGSLLVSYLSLAALSRADTPESLRRDFFLYLDEFQNVSTLTLATMLAELRKYRLNLILAHQYLGQLRPEIADAVIGNAGSIISFRLGAKDAPLFAREFAPKLDPEHLVNLPNYHCYLRLMIGSQVSKAFSGVTLRP